MDYNHAMLINHERKKLIAAIVYFVKNTNSCGKTKLFKLLYFLDFEHFKQTGRNVTGLDYFAWKLGPVPTSLYDEFDSPEPDLLEQVKFEPMSSGAYECIYIKPLANPDMSHFSKREANLLRELAERYKNVNAIDMVEKTHLESSPWHKIYIEEKKPQELIPYEYAIDKSKEQHILDLAEDSKQIKDIYR